MKQCTKCKKTKPVTDFYKRGETKDGYYQQCIKCVKAKRKEQAKEKEAEIRFF